MKKMTEEQVIDLCENEPRVAAKLIMQLFARIEKLEIEVEELKRRLDKNSKNSDKPPSSDIFRKPKSLRAKGGKIGAPLGHDGHTLKFTTTPDHTIVHKINDCNICHYSLNNIEAQIEKRQVFELPKVHFVVTEHRTEKKTCPKCNHISKAEFPEGINAPTQYGYRYKSFLSYLNIQHHIPLNRIEELSKDLLGTSINKAAIIDHNRKLYKALEPIEEEIKQDIIKSHVIHADESGVRVDKALKWIHVTSDINSTLYNIHDKRGAQGIHELGVLSDYKGTVVHDCWSAYFKEEFNYTHALCGVHLLRECQGIIDYDKHEWAQKMFDLLQQACHLTNDARKTGDGELPGEVVRKIDFDYDEIIIKGLEFVSKLVFLSSQQPKNNARKSFNLLLRFQKFKAYILGFIKDLKIPFSNNQAEQDIRMVKVKQKISGSFRTKEGASIFARIRSFCSTARKRNLNILDSIHKVSEQAFSFSKI